MKYLSQATRINLFLMAGLPLLAGHTQAAPAEPLATLSAKLQAAPEGTDKDISKTFALTPALAALSGSQSRLNGAEAAPKHLFLDPQKILMPAPGKRASLQIKRLAQHLGKDSAASKRLYRKLLPLTRLPPPPPILGEPEAKTVFPVPPLLGVRGPVGGFLYSL